MQTTGEIHREDGVTISRVAVSRAFIGLNEIVYFVSGTTGDEFGQFPTEGLALECFNKILKVRPEDRHKYDQ